MVEKKHKIQILSRDIKTNTNSVATLEKLGVNSNGTLSIMCNAGIVINMGMKEAHFLKDFLNKHYDEVLPVNKNNVNMNQEKQTVVYLDENQEQYLFDSSTKDVGWNYDM